MDLALCPPVMVVRTWFSVHSEHEAGGSRRVSNSKGFMLSTKEEKGEDVRFVFWQISGCAFGGHAVVNRKSS